MKWTKQHIRNAVAAKARRRMELAADEPASDLRSNQRVPRRAHARFTIQIRDHAVGDSITLNLHRLPWPNQWICEHGQFSSAKLGRAIGLILTGGKA